MVWLISSIVQVAPIARGGARGARRALGLRACYNIRSGLLLVVEIGDVRWRGGRLCVWGAWLSSARRGGLAARRAGRAGARRGGSGGGGGRRGARGARRAAIFAAGWWWWRSGTGRDVLACVWQRHGCAGGRRWAGGGAPRNSHTPMVRAEGIGGGEPRGRAERASLGHQQERPTDGSKRAPACLLLLISPIVSVSLLSPLSPNSLAGRRSLARGCIAC